MGKFLSITNHSDVNMAFERVGDVVYLEGNTEPFCRVEDFYTHIITWLLHQGEPGIDLGWEGAIVWDAITSNDGLREYLQKQTWEALEMFFDTGTVPTDEDRRAIRTLFNTQIRVENSINRRIQMKILLEMLKDAGLDVYYKTTWDADQYGLLFILGEMVSDMAEFPLGSYQDVVGVLEAFRDAVAALSRTRIQLMNE